MARRSVRKGVSLEVGSLLHADVRVWPVLACAGRPACKRVPHGVPTISYVLAISERSHHAALLSASLQLPESSASQLNCHR
jgi:hypothetical protein